jgi:peptidoglycan/LPS O-acetylase OafA/YrhL
MSFAFYLVHLLILCSLSSWLYIMIVPAGPGVAAGVALFVVSMIAALGLAAPLMLFDRWWTGMLDRAALTVLRPVRIASPLT